MIELPQAPSFRLDGKTAFVAGGSRGIGLGCAVALAQNGAQVTVAARGAAQLKQAVDAMQAAGLAASALVLDVSDTVTVSDIMAQNAFDILCNSAGIARHGPALDTVTEDFQAVMAVNVQAAYFMATEAARAMKAAGKAGTIIQISSQMAHVGGIDRAVYCASKHAVEGMTKAMAIEWGADNIRVNTICPTFIRTPLTESTFQSPERLAWITSKIKLPRVGEISDIMGAVQFLASDASAMVTGTSLMIDGGWTAG